MKRHAVCAGDSGSESDDIEFVEGSSGVERVPPPTVTKKLIKKRPAKLNSNRNKKQNTSAIDETAYEECETDKDDEIETDDENKTKDNIKTMKAFNKRLNRKSAFASGTFVVNIHAFLKLDKVDVLPVWKIDRNSMLQKFTAFHEDGKVLHRSTLNYTAWNSAVKKNYCPAPISYVKRSNKEDIIEFCLDKFKRDFNIGKAHVEKKRNTNPVKDDDNKTLN